MYKDIPHYYPFIRWDVPHLSALAITIAVALLLLLMGRLTGEKGSRLICRFLAILLGIEFVGEFSWRFFSDDYGPWVHNLPLHFCSFMLIIAIIAMWWRKDWACGLCYFGILSASIQGLITPAMANGYPSIAFYVFFIAHGLLLIVGLAVPILLKWRSSRWAPLRSLLLMDLYLIGIHPINIYLDTNYGYTRFSPVEGCLLDYLGAAPYYYLWLQLPVLGLFYLMSLFVRMRA
ncbi:MAG: TIGR02206 family membrane protein [Akkermansia sp.]